MENDGRLLHLQMYISFHNAHFNELTYKEINLLSLNSNSLEIYFPIAVCAGVTEREFSLPSRDTNFSYPIPAIKLRI